MNKTDAYNELENEFLSTFIGELLPGVLHNFANPLNGIMGRSKLLQRRFEDFMRKLNDNSFLAFREKPIEEKIGKDINTIALESERFLNIFGDLAGKISRLSTRTPERINLSRMIEAEVRFCDFYLDFKHDFKKNLQLDPDIPDIIGSAADYSICISTLLISAKDRMKDCPIKEISVATSHDAKNISVVIWDKGVPISPACAQILETNDFSRNVIPEKDKGVGNALLLLKFNGAHLQLHSEKGHNMVSISVPYR
jgi:signal transduction histidine kinase